MSGYETVNVEHEGPVAIVSFNRPDSLNAIEAGIRAELLAAINEVNSDDSIRVVILTGVGRAFCAGADLSEKQPDDFNVEDMINKEYKPLLMAITEAPKPWISAVNGAAAGIGSSFAMNCDLTVMADNAYLYQAFTAIGLRPCRSPRRRPISPSSMISTWRPTGLPPHQNSAVPRARCGWV